MNYPLRFVLAFLFVLVDFVLFFVPFGALFVAWIILANPPWVREFLERLDGPAPREKGGEGSGSDAGA